MASKSADPTFIARAIVLAKAQKKATEEAHATKTGNKKQKTPKDSEQQASSSAASNTGLGKRPRRGTSRTMEKRRSDRTMKKPLPKSPVLRQSPRRTGKVI
jgi:hypothetical protein